MQCREQHLQLLDLLLSVHHIVLLALALVVDALQSSTEGFSYVATQAASIVWVLQSDIWP